MVNLLERLCCKVATPHLNLQSPRHQLFIRQSPSRAREGVAAVMELVKEAIVDKELEQRRLTTVLRGSAHDDKP